MAHGKFLLKALPELRQYRNLAESTEVEMILAALGQLREPPYREAREKWGDAALTRFLSRPDLQQINTIARRKK